jgi:L-rhamnose mutarotase
MKLDPKKIVFNRKLSMSEAVKAYTILNETLFLDDRESHYYYVIIKDQFDIFIETLNDVEVYWLANKLQVTDRQAVLCLCEYPTFWEDLKDHLYMCGINDYKRYSVFTKGDLMGTDDRTWEEYIGSDEDDAMQFYTDILLIDDIISVIEIEDEV